MILYSGACIAFCEGLRYIVKNMQDVEPTIFVTVPLMLEKMHNRILKTAAKKKGGKLMLGIGKALSNATSALRPLARKWSRILKPLASLSISAMA